MRVYALGAGVSCTAGYPLGGKLFEAIDRFVRESDRVYDRFDHNKDWSQLCEWMRSNSNPAIAEAYRTKQLEHIFTALDLPTMLREDSFAEIYWKMKRPGGKALALMSETQQEPIEVLSDTGAMSWTRLL